MNRKIGNELYFRNIVRERDNWTCQKCASVEYPQAHHVSPVKNHPLFQYLPDNGITLCVYCHADAHPEMPRNLFIANAMKAKRDGHISAGKLAKELSVHPRTIVRRAVKLGILKPMQQWTFTEVEAEQLRETKKVIKKRAKSTRRKAKKPKKTTKKLHQTSLQLTIGQVEALKEIAYQQKRSMSEIAREIIAKYIDEEQSNEKLA